MTICIIGAGVVGQAAARGLRAKGHAVVFVDVNAERVSSLRAQGFTAFAPDDPQLAASPCDVSMLTVSTPTVDGHIRLECLASASRDLGRRLAGSNGYHLVVLRSTVPPGTTESLVIPAVEAESRKNAGTDFGVCMNPEYLREGTAVEDFSKPWIIVIGQYDQRSGDRLEEVYGAVDCPKYRLSLREAETQKYVHNLFNAVKITYFNEMRGLCREIHIDADRIFPLVAKSAEGMWNPQYGIRDLGPFEGSCLPKDTDAFLSWAKDRNLDVRLLETAVRVNDSLRGRSAAELMRVQASAEAPAAVAVEVPG